MKEALDYDKRRNLPQKVELPFQATWPFDTWWAHVAKTSVTINV